MNCMCVQGREYLNSPTSNKEELIQFIDKYNSKLNEYSYNGLSSYFLECVEVSIKLSRSISYKSGEAFGRLIKGNTLSLGGQFSVAISSYKKGLKLTENISELRSAFYLKLFINLLILGREEEALEYLDILKDESGEVYSLGYQLYNQYYGSGDIKLEFPKVGDLLIYENYFTLSSIFKNSIGDEEQSKEVLRVIEDLTFKSSCTVESHLESLKCLSLMRDNIGERVKDVIAQFNKRESFILYIDGLLNIAETLIKFNLPDNAFNLLTIISSEKREVELFNPRLEELKIRSKAVLTI